MAKQKTLIQSSAFRVILVILGIAVLLTLLPNFRSQTQTVKADWKTYTDEDGYFTFEYPSDWKLSYSDPHNNPYEGPSVKDRKDFTVSGKEGHFAGIWIDQYGGGCDPEDHVSMMIGGKKEDFCDHKDSKTGEEVWSSSGTELDSKSHLGLLWDVKANNPYSKNRDIILKIFSSFKFTQ